MIGVQVWGGVYLAEENKIIASNYEIIREIGAGGGGIVYLGRHRNLNKLIVLKADKRTQPAESGSAAQKHSSSLNPETLSREVDALKDLSHTYIPQVYDYVEENGVVYTVMDYIEGESLDKPLNRGEEFKQAEIIKWARQLLEALSYLHSRPPYGILHSDIKPANIMLTPQGDIRLIDFNIALFLGEEGAVRLGGSYGYASPEHYGQNLSGSGEVKGTHKTDTESLDQKPDLKSSSRRNRSGKSGVRLSGSASGRGVMVDVRSDIYGLGATLYHLLTGTRPAKNAKDVIPITKFQERNISPLIARIVTKAMNPNPDLRYQTAEEMLWDLNHLRRLDHRAKRRRRRIALAVALVIAIFLAGGFSTYVGLRRMENWKGNLLLAANSKEALLKGNVDLAVSEATDALPERLGLFDPPYAPESQRALANALGVYNLSDGYKAHKLISLSSEASSEAVKPVKVKLSPDGTLAAVLVNELEDWRIQIYDTESGSAVAKPLQAEQSATSDFIFTDNSTLLYAGADGLTSFDLKNGQELWKADTAVTNIALSADGRVAATVYRDDHSARIWNAITGEPLGEVDFHGRSLRVLTADWRIDEEFNLFALDASGERLAVSFSDSSASLYDLRNGSEESVFDPNTVDFKKFEGGFCGSFFAVAASKGMENKPCFMLINLESMTLANFSENERAFHVQADETGIYLSRPAVDAVSKINPYATTEAEVIERTLGQINSEIESFSKVGDKTLIVSKDGIWTLFDEHAQKIAALDAPFQISAADFGSDYLLMTNRDTPSLLIRKWERHPDSVIFRYDPSFHHLEAHIHTDGNSAMLCWPNRFVIVDRSGSALTPEPIEIPDMEQMRDYQYRRVGQTDRLGNTVSHDFYEIWYYDGLVCGYSAKTGELLFTEQGPTPDSLGASRLRNEEVMETEHFRAVAPLNATPEIYDKVTGERIGVLEADGNLAYIYEAGDYLVAHYMTINQEHFGMLLNRDLQVLADLPELTDVLPDGTLIFDDDLGNLRQSRVYSIENLIALGKRYKEVN